MMPTVLTSIGHRREKLLEFPRDARKTLIASVSALKSDLEVTENPYNDPNKLKAPPPLFLL